MTEAEKKESFDEFLDETNEPYKLGELTFPASDILKSCDPVAYRVYMSDWESWLEEDEENEDDETD